MRVATGTMVLLVTLGVGVLSAPEPGNGQAAARVPRIGVLRTASPPDAGLDAFRQRLRELGHVEGQGFVIEVRFAEGRTERLPDLAAELVRLPVDVLVVMGPEPPLRAAKGATSTIPIVMVATTYDPIARGYVASLRQPGGNITGLFLQQV